MLISEAYREQQVALHRSPHYGVASVGYAPLVRDTIGRYGVSVVLDYGAGKGRLGEALFGNGYRGFYHPYDPAVPYWADAPEPAQLVACIDVLEHIEPECLDAVLDDLQRLTQRVGVFTVHTGPAKKVLDDGRNAHLTQQPMEWWQDKLTRRFKVVSATGEGYGAAFIVEPLP